MSLYRVKDWHEHFENNRTKEMVQMRWVPVPNKHDGDGYTDLLSRPDGMALYGAWIQILQVASKCEPRGTLMRDTKMPHCAMSIARITRGNQKTIEKALSVLVEIGWLELIPIDDKELQNPAPSCGETAGIPQASRTQLTMEGKGMEGNGRTDSSATCQASAKPPVPPILTFPCNGSPKTWDLTAEYMQTLRTLYPTLDVFGECRKALAWIQAGKRKTAGGMQRFLVGWLNRATNSNHSRGPTLFKPPPLPQGVDPNRDAQIADAANKRAHLLNLIPKEAR